MYSEQVYIGKKFTRLTIKEILPPVKARNGRLSEKCVCDCDCGNKNLIYNIRTLIIKKNQSCGCYKKLWERERLKRYNTYDLTGDFGIGYTRKGRPFYFDLEDYNLIKDYCWYIGGGNRLNARKSNIETPFKFHRVILGLDNPKIQVDHINRNQLDNRKCNLRISSQKENSRNITLPKNNTTGYIGVYLNKETGNYYARIICDEIIHRLGTYNNIEDAIIVRLKAEKEMFGAFAPQRHLFGKYNI